MSKFIGNIGCDIKTNITIRKLIYRNSWQHKVYKKCLYLMEDTNNNMLTLTSVVGVFTVGDEWVLSGRVKRHKEFCGVPQTHITKWIVNKREDNG